MKSFYFSIAYLGLMKVGLQADLIKILCASVVKFQ